jgi:hypothetical protein
MVEALENDLSPALASELEKKFFWWEPIARHRRSAARIVAQAMNFAPFEDVLRLEREIGPRRLVRTMLEAEPGWIGDRSWEFWRGRLELATGQAIPEEPPRRSFDAAAF